MTQHLSQTGAQLGQTRSQRVEDWPMQAVTAGHGWLEQEDFSQLAAAVTGTGCRCFGIRTIS